MTGSLKRLQPEILVYYRFVACFSQKFAVKINDKKNAVLCLQNL